jgi:hypothetical protein
MFDYDCRHCSASHLPLRCGKRWLQAVRPFVARDPLRQQADSRVLRGPGYT